MGFVSRSLMVTLALVLVSFLLNFSWVKGRMVVGIDVSVPNNNNSSTFGSSLYSGSKLFNVRAFGVVGDGQTDDTKAFVAAWKEAKVESGILLVPYAKMILAPCSSFDLLLKHQDASIKCKIGKYSCALEKHFADKKFFVVVPNAPFGYIKKPRNTSIHSSLDDNVVTTGPSSKASEADSGSSTKGDPIASEPLSSTMLNSQTTEVGVDEATAGLKDSDASLQKDSLQERTKKMSSTEQMPRKPSMTAREKLRAARALSRFRDTPENPKQGMGRKVLDALRDSDKGKSRSGLPQAPTNLFDDSKRGMPKQGLTFDFPGGSDLFFIIFSFVFISSVMFATTYIVWKAGAIHFNEY